MADRIMYIKPACPHCQRARDDMGAEGLEWEERDATTRDDWREELMAFSKGTGTVPTVVLAGRSKPSAGRDAAERCTEAAGRPASTLFTKPIEFAQ